MRIISVEFVASSSSSINGKRRPTSFEPYCVIDNFPETPQDYPYRVIDRGQGRRLFFREYQGSCQFFEHNPRDEAGYGGAVFTGTLDNGSTFSVKGPQSSSCETVNALGLPSSPCAHVAVRKPSEPRSWRARCVTLPILEQIAKVVESDWRLIVPVDAGYGIDDNRASWSFGASDEQLRAIRGEVSHSITPYFVPLQEFEDCATCEGKSYILDKLCKNCLGSGKDPRRFKCFDCNGRGHLTKSCPVCGNRGFASGIVPYPFMRGFR